ncbi:hypothetical protein CCR85_01715 [Rhodothalassium salexigens]|nr:hypothetical protein [Rhodothalassium salexigens]MBK5920851.1 hypothetical protein [Rhodothalassium salexigens]
MAAVEPPRCRFPPLAIEKACAMEAPDQLLTLAALLAAAGLTAGFMAGLLGIGGGIIMTPVLYTVFGLTEVDPSIRMHAALATSLAIIVPTAVSSVRAHHARGAVDVALVRGWVAPLFVGGLAGAAFATALASDALVILFASFAALMAVRMLLPAKPPAVARTVPTGPVGMVAPTVIGGLAAMMGIGGAVFTVPYLALFSMPVHRAVGTAAFTGLVVSLIAAMGYIAGGLLHGPVPPYSLGFVNLPALAIVAPLSVAAAPWGAKVAHRLSRRQLSVLFGLFLAASSIRLFSSL